MDMKEEMKDEWEKMKESLKKMKEMMENMDMQGIDDMKLEMDRVMDSVNNLEDIMKENM